MIPNATHRSGAVCTALVLACAASLALGTVSAARTINGGGRADRLTGGPRADRLFGRGGSDRLSGRGGRDRLSGGAGADRLLGGRGRDRLYGGAGNDVLFGNAGSDRLSGGVGEDRLVDGAGNDRVIGGPGEDSFNILDRARVPGSGAGNDRFEARDGAPDTIDCGPGEDVAIVDAVEDGVFNCEVVLAPNEGG